MELGKATSSQSEMRGGDGAAQLPEDAAFTLYAVHTSPPNSAEEYLRDSNTVEVLAC